ncbi:hypothetical protein BT69DRAFT_1288677 [Atractiella rhizophila]|nr:hypothetical protein BT69DRAFT_1288677 [Atractiella rhizophila]
MFQSFPPPPPQQQQQHNQPFHPPQGHNPSYGPPQPSPTPTPHHQHSYPPPQQFQQQSFPDYHQGMMSPPPAQPTSHFQGYAGPPTPHGLPPQPSIQRPLPLPFHHPHG